VSKKIRILIVDDDLTNRLILRALTKDSGYESIEAENGQQAVEAVANNDIDVILLDVMMPVMDGYEAASILKKDTDQFIPIIFLTAMKDEASLAKCIDAGGDDFLTKPYNHVILAAKIESMLRIRQLYRKVSEQNAELNAYNVQSQQEMTVAKKVFSGLIHHDMKSKNTGLHFSMSPMSIFNGDVILAERNQSDGLNILISDFTGHGLSAALGSIPASDIFYTMSDKGFSYTEILSEINNKLAKLLPTSMFMASAFIGMDRNNNVATIVNAGIPELYLVRDNKIIRTFPSANLPLGIMKMNSDTISAEMVSLEFGDRILAATDGIMEAENDKGEMYGKQRILDSITANKQPEKLFDNILKDCLNFCGQAEQSDDVTLLEICHLETVEYDDKGAKPAADCKPSNWSINFNLDMESIRRFDVLPYLMQGINGLQAIPNGHSALLTVLTEFYANALDHGLLDLDSSMKNTAEGYMQFYQEKTDRLQKAKEGEIRIELNHEVKEEGGGRLTIYVMDSGPGFDYDAIKNNSMEENTGFSGRGMSLVNHICKEVKYLGKGNAVVAVYEWE
jgi:two-component system, HptB-dependent secretion and biofilm response regulator